MLLLGMISCATLQICNFWRRNPSRGINVSNILGGSENCGAWHMSFDHLLWEHDKFQCQWSNMAHTSFTNRTRSLSVPRDYSGDGVVYKQPEVIPTRNTPKHLPHPTGAMLWHRASSRGFPASYEFSRIQNGWIRHGAEVILPPRWLGLPLPRLQEAYACRKDIT